MVNPDAAHMNFSYLMTGAVITSAVDHYYIQARKMFTGPVVEVAIAPYEVFQQ